MALKQHVAHFTELEAGKVYIIDFDRSRRFAFGPGRQTAVDLPATGQYPPLDMKRFDPYSWDVYCVGKMFERIAKVCPSRQSLKTHVSARPLTHNRPVQIR